MTTPFSTKTDTEIDSCDHQWVTANLCGAQFLLCRKCKQMLIKENDEYRSSADYWRY